MTEPIQLPEPKGMTPAERQLWLVRTDSALLDRLSANVFAHHRGLDHPTGYWENIPEEERAAWRERTLKELEEDAMAKPSEWKHPMTMREIMEAEEPSPGQGGANGGR